jgi:formamidopyrimidine-DNA glycosylase
MPELPEVETTRRGVAPLLEGRRVTGVVVRDARLRWPVSPELPALLTGCMLRRVQRRAKYLLFDFGERWLLLHLGMSGSLRVVPSASQAQPHDHLDIRFGKQCLRLRDPRRFGAAICIEDRPEAHPLLAKLGPEPLSEAFDGDYLFRRSRGRSAAVKSFLMDQHVVVGVGNIYANESLFDAGIRPQRPAGRIARARYEKLAAAVKATLTKAITAGGTTLRDFQQSDGRPGYFRHELQVYDRAGAPCPVCGTPLRGDRIGQRASVWCPRCQR